MCLRALLLNRSPNFKKIIVKRHEGYESDQIQMFYYLCYFKLNAIRPLAWENFKIYLYQS